MTIHIYKTLKLIKKKYKYNNTFLPWSNLILGLQSTVFFNYQELTKVTSLNAQFPINSHHFKIINYKS